MRKREIDTHSLSYCGPQLPAINVKVYSYGCCTADVVKEFICTEKVAGKALEFWYEFAVKRFWDDAEEIVKEIFPYATMYSAGRSGGWLVLSGLPEIECWDACALQKFAKLKKEIRELITYLSSRAEIIEDIDRNRWAKEGAERYNFCDTPTGTKCIAELKREAIAAGFGAVVRP